MHAPQPWCHLQRLGPAMDQRCSPSSSPWMPEAPRRPIPSFSFCGECLWHPLVSKCVPPPPPSTSWVNRPIVLTAVQILPCLCRTPPRPFVFDRPPPSNCFAYELHLNAAYVSTHLVWVAVHRVAATISTRTSTAAELAAGLAPVRLAANRCHQRVRHAVYNLFFAFPSFSTILRLRHAMADTPSLRCSIPAWGRRWLLHLTLSSPMVHPFHLHSVVFQMQWLLQIPSPRSSSSISAIDQRHGR